MNDPDVTRLVEAVMGGDLPAALPLLDRLHELGDWRAEEVHRFIGEALMIGGGEGMVDYTVARRWRTMRERLRWLFWPECGHDVAGAGAAIKAAIEEVARIDAEAESASPIDPQPVTSGRRPQPWLSPAGLLGRPAPPPRGPG